MSKEIKLEAGQWYRVRGGSIVYCASESVKKKDTFLCECFNSPFLVKRNGTHLHCNSNWDIIEHLPDCDSFDWEPKPKPPKYRPFRNAEEFKPYRDKWVMRAHRGFDDEVGCYRIEGYDDEGVWVEKSVKSTYKQEFDSNRRFEDGTPFGVEVS